jgi:hypothetical protein
MDTIIADASTSSKFVPQLDDCGPSGRRRLVAFARRPQRAACALAVERSDQILDLYGLIWQRTARTFAGGVLNVPAFGDEPVETALKPSADSTAKCVSPWSAKNCACRQSCFCQVTEPSARTHRSTPPPFERLVIWIKSIH